MPARSPGLRCFGVQLTPVVPGILSQGLGNIGSRISKGCGSGSLCLKVHLHLPDFVVQFGSRSHPDRDGSSNPAHFSVVPAAAGALCNELGALPLIRAWERIEDGAASSVDT